MGLFWDYVNLFLHQQSRKFGSNISNSYYVGKFGYNEESGRLNLKIPSEMEVAPLSIDLFSRFNYRNIKMHPGFLSLTIKLLKCV